MPKVIRKETIFDAALHCFTQKGYYKATMDLIAQEAGISKPGLYLHFASKDDLFVRLFSYMGDKYFQQILTHLEQADSPEKQLQLFGEKTCQIWQEKESFYRFALEFVSISAREPAIRSIMTSYYQSAIDKFRTIIRNGQRKGQFKRLDPDMAAHSFYFIIMGQFFISQAVNTKVDANKQLRFNIKNLLEAMSIQVPVTN
jgi:AcrR family transcriptional regulator